MSKKRTALVTGASRGIGREIVWKLLSDGFSVVATARSCDLLEELQAETKAAVSSGKLSDPHVRCDIFPADIGSEADVDALFSSIPEDAGLEILINNAGISHIGLLQDMSLAQWNRMLQTNLTGAFLTCRRAIPRFLKQGCGSIVNVSSVWGNVGASCEAAYSAAKGGLNSFTRALAKELAPSNIRVNAVALGAIETEMNRHLTGEDRALLMQEIGLGRFGTPAEAAGFVTDIAVSHPYLTGEVLSMHGAWL